MLRGGDQPDKRKLVESLKPKVESTSLFMELLGRDVCIVNLTNGKVDPRFNLETVHQMHRQLIMQFMYYSLLQEKTELSRLVTNAGNVSFRGAPKASYGDMDVYAELLQIIPIMRSSDPDADALSKTVSYRLPLGNEIFSVSLVKKDSTWMINTDKKSRSRSVIFGAGSVPEAHNCGSIRPRRSLTKSARSSPSRTQTARGFFAKLGQRSPSP